MKIFIIGYPLSGKSTIGKQLAEKMGCPYLGTGAFARSLGMGLEESIKKHDFSEEFNDRIEEEVWKTIKNKDCVIDGYPRSEEQAIKILSIPDKRVIYCYANPVEIADRLKKRALIDGREEDTDDIVASRIRASVELKKKLDFLDMEMLDTADPKAMKDFWEQI